MELTVILEYGHINFEAIIKLVLDILHKLIDVGIQVMRDNFDEIMVGLHLFQIGIGP
jgi:hypothetical protein